jgi:pSer/pThr/pTyr-binding forkhead associated (FHA) protein
MLKIPARTRTTLEPDALAVVEAISGHEGVGYVESRFDDGTAQYLLFKDDRVWCAGSLTTPGGRAQPGVLSVGRFLAEVEAADEVTLAEVELPLFLCLGVLFRKAPAARIPTKLVDSEGILRGVKDTGEDAVLAIEREGAVSLVFCHAGAPVALFAAEEFPADGGIIDRVVEYILTADDPVQLFVFDEIRLPPAKDGGPIEEVAERADLERERAAVLVRLGDRVAFRYPIFKDAVLIGRGEEVDLALDNLSVSRVHARLRVAKNDDLVVEDLGSENGVVLRGNPVQRAALAVGDVLTVGKYLIEVVEASSELHRSKLPKPSRDPGLSGEETVALKSTDPPRIVRGDEELRIPGLAFSIGRGDASNLKLNSLFIADVHAVLRRGGDGGWSVRHVGGLRAVKVNGEKVKERALSSGDEIAIAGERMTFYLPESARSSSSSSRAS